MSTMQMNINSFGFIAFINILFANNHSTLTNICSRMCFLNTQILLSDTIKTAYFFIAFFNDIDFSLFIQSMFIKKNDNKWLKR